MYEKQKAILRAVNEWYENITYEEFVDMCLEENALYNIFEACSVGRPLDEFKAWIRKLKEEHERNA